MTIKTQPLPPLGHPDLDRMEEALVTYLRDRLQAGLAVRVRGSTVDDAGKPVPSIWIDRAPPAIAAEWPSWTDTVLDKAAAAALKAARASARPNTYLVLWVAKGAPTREEKDVPPETVRWLARLAARRMIHGEEPIPTEPPITEDRATEAALRVKLDEIAGLDKIGAG